LAASKRNHYSSKKDFNAALVYANENVRLNDGLWPRDNRGSIHMELKNYDLAIEDYSQAIRYDSDPKYIRLYVERGDAYFAAGKYAEALADYEQAKKLSKSTTYDQKIADTQAKLAGDSQPAPAQTTTTPAAPAQKQAPTQQAPAQPAPKQQAPAQKQAPVQQTPAPKQTQQPAQTKPAAPTATQATQPAIKTAAALVQSASRQCCP